MTDATARDGGPEDDPERRVAEVLDGLLLPQKEISPRYLYDRRGSELFEDITRLSEYYPTRRERALLEVRGADWVRRHAPGALVELGAGSARKSRVLLDAMVGGVEDPLYVPIDVSAAFLAETAEALRDEYPGLRVVPAVRDITEPLELDTSLPRPSWFALLGSTIGNFEGNEAAALLGRVAGAMRPGDRFLLGVDRRPGPDKPRAVLERAYNDEAGTTAAFNLNALRVLNHQFGADFDPSCFRHRAFYDTRRHRIEMHLVATRPQEVRLGGRTVSIQEGESLRTEVSCKHDRSSVAALFAKAGLELDDWAEDADGYFALALGTLCP